MAEKREADGRTYMTRREAFKVLRGEGWNYNGAAVIIDCIDNLEQMTRAELLRISDDYRDR